MPIDRVIITSGKPTFYRPIEYRPIVYRPIEAKTWGV